MGLVFGCIAPHGPIVIPELAGPDPSIAATTRAAFQEIGRRAEALEPDTIVVLTPHGIRVEGTMAISVSERAYGVQGAALSGPDGGPTVTLDFAVDGALGHAIAERAFHHYIPATRYIFGGSAGPFCRIPLDWGANVPLYFLGHTWAKKPKVVVICPSRKLARPHFVQFGRAIAEAAEASGSRVVLVASADHAHAHRDTGPYGFHPAAAEFDNQMVEAVKAEDLMRLLHTDDTLIKNAAPDSLWQMLILGGALEVTPMRAEFLSYEVPQYYGCICAAYTPTNGS